MGVRLYDVARQLLAGRGRARRGRAAREKGRWRLGRKAHRTGVVVVAVGVRHIGHLTLYDVVLVGGACGVRTARRAVKPKLPA